MLNRKKWLLGANSTIVCYIFQLTYAFFKHFSVMFKKIKLFCGDLSF